MPQAPVAIFVGGTSGIGRGMAEAFAHHMNGNARIIIIGRNQAAATEIIRSFPKPTKRTEPNTDSSPSDNPEAIHEFISADFSSISDVHETAKVLLDRLQRVDYLVLTQGVLLFAGRKETKEGLDEKMALSYYSRWTITRDLLPLLRKSENHGGARVYSVLSAGRGDLGSMDVDDLDLKKHYTIEKCRLAVSTYNDLSMQKFAKEDPQISFSHAYPGLVRSAMITSSRWWLTTAYYLFYPFFVYFSQTPEAAGKIHISACMASPPGFNSYGEMGESLKYTPADEEMVEYVWKHTLEVTESLKTE
ncbi:NAD(P)-binding protein [Lentinula aciculospora]|uniref:NAD(P)-binding protein n=1 Tax=Lentinula aciculospora TaxID=153920 RepID=A0A9W9AID5_9AGAR|nr:NAD(P)-binding protein [Lentinula aciculospora]